MCPTQAAGIKLALLGSLCASSPLTALRLDGSTGLALGNITVVRNAFGGYVALDTQDCYRIPFLECICSLGSTLRQLALLNAPHVNCAAAVELLRRLPQLQVCACF